MGALSLVSCMQCHVECAACTAHDPCVLPQQLSLHSVPAVMADSDSLLLSPSARHKAVICHVYELIKCCAGELDEPCRYGSAGTSCTSSCAENTSSSSQPGPLCCYGSLPVALGMSISLVTMGWTTLQQHRRHFILACCGMV